MTARAHASIVEELRKEIEGFRSAVAVERVGTVLSVGDGIARMSGLKDLKAAELVRVFDADGEREKAFGVALNLEEDHVGIVLLSESESVREGDRVKSTGTVLSVGVGEALLGRVVDPLGRLLDGGPEIAIRERAPIENIAPSVIARQSVNAPLQTGLVAIDALIPIGRGQRELIIGDRQTGKTAIALDTILNQKGQNVVCVYVAIGQKHAKTARLVEELRVRGALEYTIVVAASASDPAALQFVAPYAGCAMAEHFRDRGKDALIVYDDLSKHAVAYREVSLLLGRPSGREAYPGDVFYLHSRLLERAAKLNAEHGGGSLTALPIIETQAGDVSAYIPTNVISITDGQIYLESDLFYQGVRPALNVGLSVSRVGSAAQAKAMKSVAGKLRLDLAQYRELAAFAQFGSDLDPETRARLERGRRLTELLKQLPLQPYSLAEEVVLLTTAVNGYVDHVPVADVRTVVAGILDALKTEHPEIFATIERTGELTEVEAALNAHVERVAAAFTPSLSSAEHARSGREAAPTTGAEFTTENHTEGRRIDDGAGT